MSLRSPLSRARGLGAAKEGTQHWWMQRVTAIAMAPLMLWFMFSLATLAGADYAAVASWLSRPINTALMLLLVTTLFYHSLLGTQVVVEDYVASEPRKIATLLALRFLHAILVVCGIVAILKVSLA
jgi:succinate dehydrogenase / fumarate reductase membrane anchor subunit